MGVWIETLTESCIMREERVTPCMGVWIETQNLVQGQTMSRSHPVWVCGLKLIPSLLVRMNVLSHPVWVCGLKHVKCKL